MSLLNDLQNLTKVGKIRAKLEEKERKSKETAEAKQKELEEHSRKNKAVKIFIKYIDERIREEASNGKTESLWYTSNLDYHYIDIKEEIIKKVKEHFIELNPEDGSITENVMVNYDFGTYEDKTFYFVKFSWEA